MDKELGSIVVSYQGRVNLVDYLKEHESEIAAYINDFGNLNELFVEVIGREPVN